MHLNVPFRPRVTTRLRSVARQPLSQYATRLSAVCRRCPGTRVGALRQNVGLQQRPPRTRRPRAAGLGQTKRQQSSFLPEPLVFIIDDSAIVKRGRCDRRRTANPDAGAGLQATAMNHPASGPNGSEARRGSAGRLRLKHRILPVD